MTIIVVDDDAEIRDVIKEYLTDEGFDVREAEDGASLFARIAEKTPQLVLLDLRLPEEDGLSLARTLRERYPDIGIVIISGKEDLVDRVAGLEVGADDYIVKPFHMREVLARMRSVLRRREGGEKSQGREAEPENRQPVNNGLTQADLYQFSGWALSCAERTLTFEDGTEVELTNGEFDLLVAFASHPKRALSRDQLLDLSRNGSSDAFDRSVDVQVGRLRRKIEQDHRRPALIKTVRNVGYIFQVDVTASQK
jgi:two-component system OmpR family response regulator